MTVASFKVFIISVHTMYAGVFTGVGVEGGGAQYLMKTHS